MSTYDKELRSLHRQQGFAAKNEAGNYLFRCVCGWTSGWTTSEDGKKAMSWHVVYPNWRKP